MIDADLLNTLSSLSTPLLVDARLRLGLPEGDLDPGIRPVVPFSRMVGTAVTVRLEAAERAGPRPESPPQS
jgi:regulator of RNase E activity RraA